MWTRWRVGPVFACEWLIASRRWQMYATRSVFVALILGALTVVWKEHTENRRNLSGQQAMAALGESFYHALISTELTLLLLAAPAATAGALCVDKTRGTLLHLLVTDLSDPEIVLGKLAARLTPLLGLLGCSIPIMFICTLMGGIDPEALAGAFLVMLAVAVLGCTIALTLSVWGTKTYEVLVATYLIWILVILAYPLWWIAGRQLTAAPAPPSWLWHVNPYALALAPYSSPGSVTAEDYLIYLATCFAVCAGLVLLSAARLRSVAIRQSSRPAKARVRTAPAWRHAPWRLFGPSLTRNPVLWREWQRRRPSRWSRFVWGTYLFLAIGFSVLAVVQAWGTRRVADMPHIVITLQVVVGLLLLSAAAPAPLAEERAHGSLDLLLTTPLRTSDILWAKWRAAFRTVPRLAALPLLTLVAVPGDARHWVPPLEHFGLLLADDRRLKVILLLCGLFLAYGTALTSLGLAVATWMSRLGRAITCTVTAYVLVTIGWPFLIMFLAKKSETSLSFIMGSPFAGMAFVSSMEHMGSGSESAAIIRGAVCWIAVYLSAALILYLATWATFDRCLGRTTHRRPPKMPTPREPATVA